MGDNVNTDDIIPGRYLHLQDPDQLAAHCFEDVLPTFRTQLQSGNIIVAGRNFGCGSSREAAPVALKATGAAAVIAMSFARIFYRNAINIGFPIFESRRLFGSLEEGTVIEVDLEQGLATSEAGAAFEIIPFPTFVQSIIRAGGLTNYGRTRLQGGARI
jgi:3-isopropylmalate/(R)-2-methylmalate dehydratase small subunit